MADARSDECHPKCVSLPSVLFSATTLLVSLRLELVRQFFWTAIHVFFQTGYAFPSSPIF